MNAEAETPQLTEVIRPKHIAPATEHSYRAWLRRYLDDLKAIPFHLPSEQKLERFLTALAGKDVAATPQIKPLTRLFFAT